jgi:hypothetical protein
VADIPGALSFGSLWLRFLACSSGRRSSLPEGRDGHNTIDAFERAQSGGLQIGTRPGSVTWITASCKEFCYTNNIGRSRDIRCVRKRLNAMGDTMGKLAMTSLKGRSKGWRMRIAPRIRNGVDRTTNFATKVDLMIAQYSAEEREEIAELLRILTAKPQVRHHLEARAPSSVAAQ